MSFRRSLNWFQRPWRTPLIGLACGLIYGLAEHAVDLESLPAPEAFMVLDDAIVLWLPALLGLLAGFVINAMRRQERFNQELSTENTKLQRDVYAQLLSSHLLHEIRNPLHNLSAGIERWREQLNAEQVSFLSRNLERLESAMRQLTRWDVVREQLDTQQIVALRRWLDQFISDKVRPQLLTDHIPLDMDLDDVIVRIPPVFLELCFVTLFNNALEAASAGTAPRGLRLTARTRRDLPDMVEICLSNSGQPFSDKVLAAQGAQLVESSHGAGLGLVLVRRTLEQVGGTFVLANEAGWATVTLQIPGRSS